MESTNIFSGMNGDNAKVYQSDKEYIRARNFRPVTTIGESNGSLTNIKGNTCELTFPVLRKVYKLAIATVESGGAIVPGVVTINVNGQSTNQITIDGNTTTKEIHAYIEALTNRYTDTYGSQYTFSSAYNDEYIYIYQTTEYRGCSITEGQDPVIIISLISGSSTVKYVTSTNSLTTANTPYIAAQTTDALIVIGSTFINESDYIFTCGNANTNGLGQIWKLDYDESTKVSSLKLLYNNYISLSKQHPVPPTATVGRYEVPTIQRIYWSDNYNPIRSINTADTNVFAIEPHILNMRPSVEMSVATLNNVINGGATTPLNTSSTYQCSYRLIKNNGQVTNYAPLSNIIYPIYVNTSEFDEVTNKFASVRGSATTVNKTLVWEVQGIDTSFDLIEFVIVVRNHPDAETFTVNKYETKFISGNSTTTTTFKNDTSNFEEVSEEEFLIDNVSFTHCKTLDSKDNRLFFGNVRTDLGEYLETFDTRVFRFSSASTQTRIKARESSISYSTHTISSDSDYANISETEDNIPIYNLDNGTGQDTIYTTGAGYNFKYQRNSTDIGGTGKNISFKFGTILLNADKKPALPTTTPVGNTYEGTNNDVPGPGPYLHYNGFRVAGVNTNSQINPFFSNGSAFQDYRTRLIKNTMGLEYYSGNFKSYQHNEIYRFGIVFHGKTGSKYFVKWIGDIKFPDYGDAVPAGMRGMTAGGVECTDFRSMFHSGGNAYSVIPYIQFDVTIPIELSNLISGYEIVRVKRETTTDRTVLNQGLINQVYYLGGADSGLAPSHNTQSITGIHFMDPSNDFGTIAEDDQICLHPFKPLVDNTAAEYETGDRIIVTEMYNYTINGAVWPELPAAPASTNEYYYITKFYNRCKVFGINKAGGADKKYTISSTAYVGQNGTATTSTGTFYNKDFETNAASDPCAHGCPMILAEISDTINWSDFDDGAGNTAYSDSVGPIIGTSKVLAIQFKFGNLTNQYGGRTYVARAANEYISTGAFYRVDDAGVASLKVFGGDMYHGVLDIQKAIKAWSSAAAEYHSQTWFFPTQSIYNVDLREGLHVNAYLNEDAGANASGHDDYSYTHSYSYENDFVIHVPRPLLFNDTSSYNNRVCWSEVKINAETADKWTVTPTDNYYDLDGNYGPINSLISLGNAMYAIQDRAFSELLINPYAVIQDNAGVNLKLGTGEILQRHIHKAIDVGTSHQWSVYASNKAITFVDAKRRKIYLYDGQSMIPISDVKGQRGFLNKVIRDTLLTTDNPTLNRGIITTYDFLNNEFLYTFHNTVEGINLDDTLVYSDLTNSFTSFYDFKPTVYINNHTRLYTSSPTGFSRKLFQHNKGNYCTFYDQVYPSTLKVSVSKNPLQTKVFDNISWHSESIKDEKEFVDDVIGTTTSDNIPYIDDTINRVRCYNEYQNSDFVTLDQTPITGNLRRLEQSYNIHVPRNKVDYDLNGINTKAIFDPTALTKTEFGERLRDKYMIVDLEYPNTNGNRFILHNLTTKFRVSDR
jgi:hypothetical protein